MIEYVDVMNRRFLTSEIKKSNERFQIVTDMLYCIDLKIIGVHEYGQYLLSIEDDKITLVTPTKIYTKTTLIH